jgi:hypothetical protein
MVKGFGPPTLQPNEVREAKILRARVIQHFQQLKDPRVDRTKRHSLMAIITRSDFCRASRGGR